MSYNNYYNNQYSPYFQQTPEQERRAAFSNPLSRNTAPNQYTYQPLSAYQSSHQQQQQQQQQPQQPPSQQQPPQQQPSQQQTQQSQPPPHSTSRVTTSYGNQGYGVGSATGSQQLYNQRSDGRRSLDTTALGSLAYASSLGRDRSPAQQVASYNRPSTAGFYGNAGTYRATSTTPVSDAPQGTYSHAPATTNVANQQRLQSPTYPPASNGQTSYQEQSYRIQRPDSQVATPTVVATAQPDSQQPASFQRGAERKSASKTPTGFRPTSSTPTPRPQQPWSLPASSSQEIATRTNLGGNPVKPNNASQVSSAPQVNNQTNDLRTHPRRPSIPVETQHPTTVDPTQIFNHYEHQKRQATAAASAAAEAEAAQRKATEAVPPKVTPASDPIPANGSRPGETRSQSVSCQASDIVQAARAAIGSPVANPDSAKKEQMELEMKQMIEKMRDYKAKDPSLFSQIWEQVKKSQSLPQTAIQSAVQTSSDSHTTSNGQVQSPTQLPQESRLSPASSFPEGFDRGRFPHQRRRRGARQSSTPRMRVTPTNINQPESATPVSFSHLSNSNNRPNAASTPTPAPPITARDSDATNERLQKALQEFNKSSELPMPQPVAHSQQRENHTNTSTPTPVSAPPGKIYWPAHIKQALADAARNALTSIPSNNNKNISSDEIVTLLDQNPSYSEICQNFEERGFIIDRGHLARLLLSAVPDMAGPPKQLTNTPQNVPTATRPPPPKQNLPRPQSYSRPNENVTPRDPGHRPMPLESPQQEGSVPQGVSGNTLRWGEDRNMTREKLIEAQRLDARGRIVGATAGPHSHHTTHSPYTAQRPPSVPIANMQPAPQAKSTKEDKARKRSFGEIVDLTQDFSDEEFERHRPKPRIDYMQNSKPVDPASRGPPTARPSRNSSPINLYKRVQNGTVTPGSGAEQIQNLDQFRYKSTIGREHLWSEKVIEPMNKRKNALRRSTYSPKTIARDILLASGRHPTMAPLNHHLEILREKFQSVNWDSDLSTFRWDLVDPGGDPPRPRPPPALYQPPAISAPKLPETDTHDDADDEDTNAFAARPTPRRRGRPRIDAVVGEDEGFSIVPPETTMSPSIKNGSLRQNIKSTAPQHLAAGNKSTPPPSNGREVLVPMQQPSDGSVIMDSINVAGSSFTPAARFIAPPASLPSSRASASNTTTSTRTPGRIGRPPGAKNKNPRPDKGIPKKKTPSDRTPNGAGGGNNTIPARPHVSDSTSVRPSGLRNARTLEHGVAVVIQSRSPSVADPGSAQDDKRKWSNMTEGSSGRHPSTPFYKVYKCKWNKCPAELHNLETLRKHVRKHRDRGAGPFPCKWEDCNSAQFLKDKEKPSDGDGELEWLDFESEKAWDKHVESKHINQYAWQLGDGPATHPSDVESSDYRSDSYLGRSQSPRAGRTISPRGIAAIRPQIIVPLSTSNASSVASGAQHRANDRTGEV